MSRILVAMMVWARSKRELVPAVAIVVALLMLEIGLGSGAEASCGAYLHTAVMGRVDDRGLNGNANATDTTQMTDGVATFGYPATEPVPMNRPCSGPGCSRGSMPPFVPALPVTTEPHRIDVYDVHSVAATGNDFTGQRTSTTATVHALRGFPPMIEVPPEGDC